MSDNLSIKDAGSVSRTMRATDTGSAFVPHHIVDPVAIAPIVSSAMENGHILSATPCSLAEMDIFVDLDCYIAIINATAVPADGAMTPLKFFPLASGSWFTYSPKVPLALSTGLVVVCSSNASPFTLAKTAHMFVSASLGNTLGALI